jgi:hypothetical protein
VVQDLGAKKILATVSVGSRPKQLTGHPPQCFDEFSNLSALFAFVTRNDRMLDTMGDVLLDDLVLDACERGTDSCNLGQDVDAVSIFIEHSRNAANLTFDAVQALKTGILRFC